MPTALGDVTSTAELAGLSAATTAALLWAFSSMLYGQAGKRLTAVWMNFTKGAIASLLFIVTLLVLGRPLLGPMAEAPWQVALLALSGIIGIAVGDTAYFACLRRLGARQAALLSLLSVPAASAGGLALLGERLPLLGVMGIAITLAGIAWVVAEKPNGAEPTLTRSVVFPGLLLGLAAALCQAAGALINRSVIRDGAFDDLWTATWRLVAATVALCLFLPFFPRRPVESSGKGRLWIYVLPATVLGSFAGIWLQQFAFARADTGYVQTLLSTTPIWILPIAMLAGERVTWRAVLGSVVGLGGVVLLIYSSSGP